MSCCSIAVVANVRCVVMFSAYIYINLYSIRITHHPYAETTERCILKLVFHNVLIDIHIIVYIYGNS